jgi:hypothetical protein
LSKSCYDTVACDRTLQLLSSPWDIEVSSMNESGGRIEN